MFPAQSRRPNPHWRAFISSLKERGIGIPDRVTADAHEGLGAARRTIPNASPGQRCQFPLQQNAQSYVPDLTRHPEVGADRRSVFDGTECPKAEARLDELVEKYRGSAPKLARWMEDNLPEGLTVFLLPQNCRKRLRPSNRCENLNRQIKRRTRVAGLFPNEASVRRLVTASLRKTSEEWETGRAHLSVSKQS